VAIARRWDPRSGMAGPVTEDRRLFPTMADWERFRVSPHRRHGHAERLSWCEWCVRLSEEDARLSVAPAAAEAIPDETLWGGAAPDDAA